MLKEGYHEKQMPIPTSYINIYKHLFFKEYQNNFFKSW